MAAEILREGASPVDNSQQPVDQSPPAPTPFDALSSQIQSVYGGVLGARGEQQAGLERKAAAVNPRLTAVQTATDDFAKQIQEQRAQLEASKPQITRPPSRALSQYLAPHEGESPEASVGKLISGLTMFATGLGGLAKGDATAGLAAFKGALQGWHEGDKERADRAFADWKAKTDAALKQWEVERTSYLDWIEAGNMSLDQMLKGAELEAIKHDNANAAKAFQTGTMEGALGFLQQERNHADQVAATTAKLVESKQRHEDALAEQTRRREETERHNKELESIAKRKEARAEREAPGEGEFDVDIAARRLIRGDAPTAIVRGIGKAATKRFEQTQHRAAEILREQGLSEEQIATALSSARMTMQANSAALTKITTQEAQIAPFAETARDSLRRARDLSNKIDRSGTPVVNRWVMAGRKEVEGDADVAAFDYHIRLGINEVAKITSSATGGGGAVSDTARREIESTLNRTMTREQIAKVIDAADYEMSSRLRHLARQKEALLGGGPAIGGPKAPAPAADNDPLGIRR